MLSHKIWVIGGRSYGDVVSHLGEVTYKTPKTVDEFKELDLIMFTGGEDVHPKFYKGVHTNFSYCNEERDINEIKVFDLALKHGIKITGICRGHQFINVMCGGKMYQHITNHAGRRHNVIFPAINKTVEVTSTHHQLVKPDWNVAIPVAWSAENRSDVYIGPDAEEVERPLREIESLVYPEFNAFGVQFHPEMMGTKEPGRELYETIIKAFLNESIEFFVKNYAYEVKYVRQSGAET